MSWVADEKAVASAAIPRSVSPPVGPISAMAINDAPTINWESSNQPRRLPNRPSKGTSTRSMTGAQRNLNE